MALRMFKSLGDKVTTTMTKSLNMLSKKPSEPYWERVPHELWRPDQIYSKPCKKLMFIGATGSGKTTFINSYVNYWWNTKYKDMIRLFLVEHDPNADQTKSQTKVVSSYFLEPDKSKSKYDVVVFDTPGFLDTDGEDSAHVDRLVEVFRDAKSMDAFVFVIKASENRLIPSTKAAFDAILQLFGDDVGKNIFIVFTFGDGNEPQALNTVKSEGVPYNTWIAINNEGFRLQDKNNKYQRLHFEESLAQIEHLDGKINDTEPVLLQKSTQVLEKRDDLKNHLKQIPEILHHLAKNISCIEVKIRKMEKIEQDIVTFGKEAQEYENYEILEDLKYEMVWCPTGHQNLVNNNKKTTCEQDVSGSSRYFGRSSISWLGYCSVCKESYSSHTLEHGKWKSQASTQRIFLADMYEKYKARKAKQDEAINEKQKIRYVILEMEREKESLMEEAKCRVKEMIGCIKLINRDAMKKNVETIETYLNGVMEDLKKDVSFCDKDEEKQKVLRQVQKSALKVLEELREYALEMDKETDVKDLDNNFLYEGVDLKEEHKETLQEETPQSNQ